MGGLMAKPIDPNTSQELHCVGETDIRVENSNPIPESNVLVTVSDKSGEHTYLITGREVIQTHAGLFVQAPEERVVVGPKAWYRRTAFAFKWFGYVLATVLLTFSVFSFSGAVKARVVLTASMVPTINPGDIIITVPTSTIAPKVGRIVAYVGRRFDGTAVGVFSHRIIGGDAQKGFIVKGDHNPSPDTQHPKIPDITGVVIFIIPIIGRFLTPHAMLFVIPVIIGLWLIIDALKNE